VVRFLEHSDARDRENVFLGRLTPLQDTQDAPAAQRKVTPIRD
jgi:hypothetical protein